MERNLLEDVKRRVLSPGPFASWKHEQSNEPRFDLSNLAGSAQEVLDYAKRLPMYAMRDDDRRCRQAAFAIMQNLYPIVEALDTDAGLYLGQAVEALKR